MKILFYCGINNLVNFNRIRPYYDLCYGFDANPDKIEYAKKMYRSDPGVKIIYGALMEKGGEEVEFTITTDWDPASSLGSPNPEYIPIINNPHILAAQKKIKVPTINLYDFCISNDISEIDTLITDLQGIDFTVIKTLSKFIQAGKIREIQCEAEPDDTPTRYLGIPPGKLKNFNELLSGNYDVLWMDPPGPPEGSWEMDVRWRIKGSDPIEHVEFIVENELLVPNVSTYLVNSVYGHRAENDLPVNHRGNISVISSSNPIEGCDAYVYTNAFSYKGKKGGLDILLMLEPVVVLPGEYDQQVWKHFDHIFSPFDVLAAQDDKFHKILFPRADIAGKNPVTEILSQRESLYPLSGRKNAICMIGGNKNSHVPGELYSKRVEIAQWFSKNSKMTFDVYGNPPFALPNYRGIIPDGQKLAVQKQYRFSLCFENTNHPILSAGYVTEKILDCLETRTIPIYLGASNIEQYIPPECFIDFRTFVDFRELDIYLHSISEKKYKNYIAEIDAFVCGGGLRKYSESELYNYIVKVLIDEESWDAKYFSRDIGWKPGISSSLRKTEWKTTDAPTMWTWKHLSRAQPPLVENEKIVDRWQSSQIQPAGVCTERGGKSFLIGQKPSITVLAAGGKYYSGNARRGYDYGWWNLFDALNRFENIDVQFFDYITEAQQRGIAGMSERLEEIVGKEKPDVLFYSPSNPNAGILHESLKHITDHTDTQTVIWMNDSDRHFNSDAGLWAPCADYIITTSHDDLRKYQEAGSGQKIIKSQWAFNPFTYPMNTRRKTRDISFVGSAWGNRTDMIDKMRQSGLSADTFGDGWHEDSFIPFYDMVRIFGQSRINLNLWDTKAASPQPIPRRLFEVTGCGGFLITMPMENLEEYYEPDKEVLSATSLEELIDKCRYYLNHEHERETIALCGYERTIKEHTWTHRLRDIFKHLGFTVIPKPIPMSSRPLPLMESSKSMPVSATGNAVAQLTDHDDEVIDTTINIMAYNQLEYTKKCVESILHYTKEPYELLLTDNGSTDGTSEYFTSIGNFHPHTRIIRNFKNRIAESTVNYSTSIARGEYYVFVSNDTLVHEDWLENLIRHIESAPEVGWVGPRSNNISGPQLAPAAYDTLETFQTFAAERSKLHRGENFPVERLAGMLVITKKKYFERIGGADPYLPANGRDGGYGFSDDDISLRFLLAGYKLLVANDVFIHHYGSVSAKQYRPDLFGAPQNINKKKYLKKLQRNDRIIIGPRGEHTLKPYGLDGHIPVAENTVIRSPRVCIIENDVGVAEGAGRPIRYAALADSYHGAVVSLGNNSTQPLLTQVITSGEYDFIALIAKRLAPSPEKVQALIETALCYPDVAVMVPIGNYAPSTHAHSSKNAKNVEIIQYADMSFCVINAKIIRPFISGLAQCSNDEDFFFFLQRRVRGESYFIAKANNIIADIPCINHPYDSHPLPEQLVQEKKYAEALALYKDDLSKDPTFVESLYQLAYIAKEQHQSTESIKYAEDALQIDPHHIQTLILLSRIFLEQGDLKRAESVVRQANFKQPGNPEVQKIVGLYEAQLKGQPSMLQAAAVKEIPSLIHPEFVKGLTSIIIPVQSIHLNECVAAIKQHTGEPHEIIFLDHGATPKLKKLLAKTLKENSNYKAIKIGRKVSLTQTLNEGINQSTGENIVLLFDDVMVCEGWLSDMLEFLNRGKMIGIVGAMSDNASALQRVEGINLKSLEERISFRARNRHRRIQTRNLDGFCMLFRRDLLIKIGLFDEIFLQDKHVFDDFCVRAVLEGYDNFIAGSVFVHNLGGIDRLLSRDKTLFDEKWIGLDPSTPLAEKVLIANAMETARSQYHKGAIVESGVTLIRQIGFSPSEKRLFYQLAETLLAENRHQDALDALKGMPEVEDDAEYYVLQGYGNEGVGFYNDAAEYADKALAMDGRSAPALNLKGILSYRQDDMDKAEAYFLRAIEDDPGYGDPHTNMGMLRWKTEQMAEAVDFFEKGFLLSPDEGDLVNAYHSAISTLELYERAEPIFREARSAYPENKRILFLLIDILLKQSNFAEAMNEVEKAMVYFGMDAGILAAALEIRRKIGAKSIVPEGKAKAAPTLSVCMIVKNEERYLANCLFSLSPIADEMIVVDTGSTDKTKEIAAAFGAQLYDFEWTNDFAVARNISLSKAKGDWILVMDADEVLSFQDHAKLKKLLSRKGNIAYNLVTRNYINRTAGDGWAGNDNTYIYEQAGRGWFPSGKVRLFPNNEKIRFEQPIHELVEYSLERIGIDRQESGIPVHHYGELDAKQATIKDLQYYELGLQKLKESNGDFKSVWELAVQAGELGKTEESIELWHRVLGFKQRESTVYFNLANHYIKLGKYEESYDCSRKSYALDPLDQSAVLSYAMSEFLGGDINKAISALEGFLKGTDSQTSMVALLAVSYLLSGEKGDGLKYLRGLVKKKYNCVYYLKELSQSLIGAGNLARAKLLLTTAIEIKFYDQETTALLAKCEAGE